MGVCRATRTATLLTVSILGLLAFTLGGPGIRAATAPGSGVAAQSGPGTPLPDRDRFIGEVRRHLQSDEDLQSQYTYLERRQDVRVSKLGKIRIGDIRLFEVYPSNGGGGTYRRLIAVNGVPLPAQELERRDAERRRHLEERALSREHETPDQRRKREQREADNRRRRQERIEDVFRAYDIELVGRDIIDGESMIVVSLEPRPGAQTRSDRGKYLKKLRGRAWVAERDAQVVKVEVEAIDDLLIGWGIAGRVHEGSRLTFERRKVNDEVWLPFREQIEVSGRALVFRKFRVELVTEYSEYRKFEVATRETYAVPPR